MFIDIITSKGRKFVMDSHFIHYNDTIWSSGGRRTRIEYKGRLYDVRYSWDEILAQIAGEEDWQDWDRCWLEVDRVYETRWDCMAVPGGARKVA